MRKKTVIFLLFLLGMQMAQAQQKVQVSGHITGLPGGALVRVIVYADQFSLLEKTVAEMRVNTNSDFQFLIPLKQTTYAMLAVNFKRTPFFVKPGAMYRFDIKPDTTIHPATRFWGQPLQVQMQAKDDSLNARIGDFEYRYGQLVDRHFRAIYMYHNRQIVQDFERQVSQLYKQVNDRYLKDYIRYTLASLHWGARMESLPEIVGKYFSGQPVLYQNTSYTRFFRQFFDAYFKSTVKRPVTLAKLARVVPLRSLTKLDALFAEAPALAGDARVRQLAEMVQLADCFFLPDFNRKDVDTLFQEIARHSRFPENKQVAKDYILKLNQLQPGTPAPAFLLPDIIGREVSLGDFRGKSVLLSFVHTHCPVCQAQLKQLEPLQKNLTNFTNLTIVSGKPSPAFMQNMHPADRGWPFLLLGNDILLLEKYQVVTYPAYVLIDPQGKISMAPAPMPDENLQQRIKNAIDAFKAEKKNKIK